MHFVGVNKDLDIMARLFLDIDFTCRPNCLEKRFRDKLLKTTICKSRELMVILWVFHIHLLNEYASCVWNVGHLRDS